VRPPITAPTWTDGHIPGPAITTAARVRVRSGHAVPDKLAGHSLAKRLEGPKPPADQSLITRPRRPVPLAPRRPPSRHPQISVILSTRPVPDESATTGPRAGHRPTSHRWSRLLLRAGRSQPRNSRLERACAGTRASCLIAHLFEARSPFHLARRLQRVVTVRPTAVKSGRVVYDDYRTNSWSF